MIAPDWMTHLDKERHSQVCSIGEAHNAHVIVEIFAGIMPFLGIVIFAMFLMYMFPGIALWLPETLFAD